MIDMARWREETGRYPRSPLIRMSRKRRTPTQPITILAHPITHPRDSIDSLRKLI
jgi:hypothetical protein